MKQFLHLQLSSRKTDVAVGLSVTIILLIVAWTFMARGSEPRYQGRALSMWVADLDAKKAGDVRERAKIVLTEAARAAAPRFIRALRAKDSDSKLSLIGLARKQGMAFGFRTADERRGEAVAKFVRFNVGAIPVVTNLFDDPALAGMAINLGTRPIMCRQLWACD